MSIAIGNTTQMGQSMERIDVLGTSIFRCTLCGYTNYSMHTVRGHAGSHFAKQPRSGELTIETRGRTKHDPVARAAQEVTKDLGRQVNRLVRKNAALKAEVRQLRKERTNLMRALRGGRTAA